MWASTRRSIEWATIALHLGGTTWSFLLGGPPMLGMILVVVFPFLFASYELHHIVITELGIELRTLWWRELVRWPDIFHVDTRPKYRPKTKLLTMQSDPPWQLVVSRSRGKLVVSGRRSEVKALLAAIEDRCNWSQVSNEGSELEPT